MIIPLKIILVLHNSIIMLHVKLNDPNVKRKDYSDKQNDYNATRKDYNVTRMRSSLVVRASDCQCTSCNGPGFDPSVGTVESEGWQMKQCWI